jgi:hypothetical protein
MYRAFPGSDYYGGSASVSACRPHTCRTLAGGAHAFPCYVWCRHRVEVDALYPPVPAPCRLDRLDVPFLRDMSRPVSKGPSRCAYRHWVDDLSPIVPAFRVSQKIKAGQTSIHLRSSCPHSASRSGVGWVAVRFRLFPGLQTTGGIAPVACLVRLRSRRNLSPSGALPHTRGSRSTTRASTAHGGDFLYPSTAHAAVPAPDAPSRPSRAGPRRRGG